MCNFALSSRETASFFIRLLVLSATVPLLPCCGVDAGSQGHTKFKVKIMLLDFQTTVMLASVAIATVLSVVTLTKTNMR